MSRYKKAGISKTKDGNSLKYSTTLYQRIPESINDVHVITTSGDRLDILAYQYYGDPQLWWYIAQANHLSSMNVEEGLQLRIPSDVRFEDPL
tara:strand:+ start:1187 stop:1462 length:276 start_codon:yes stop_codon:yes gene_type:complete